MWKVLFLSKIIPSNREKLWKYTVCIAGFCLIMEIILCIKSLSNLELLA